VWKKKKIKRREEKISFRASGPMMGDRNSFTSADNGAYTAVMVRGGDKKNDNLSPQKASLPYNLWTLGIRKKPYNRRRNGKCALRNDILLPTHTDNIAVIYVADKNH